MKQILAILAIAILASGCASLGDGKLSPTAKKAASAALTAGSLAAPQYAEILSQIRAEVEKSGGVVPDPLAGYSFTRTYFYDGSPVPDPSRITWVDKWEKTASAGEATPPIAGKDGKEVVSDEDDALAQAIADILSGVEE